MKISEIRKKSEEELTQLLKVTREQMRELRFKITAKQYKDVRDLRGIKKDIARIITALKEKEVLKGIQKGKGTIKK